MATNFREATNFSLFIFGDCTVGDMQPWGKVAIGGNAIFNNVACGVGIIPTPPFGTADTVVVKGNFTWNTGENVAGNTVVYPGSTYTFNNVLHLNATTGDQPLRTTPVDFTAAEDYLKCASTQWAALDSTGTAVVQPGTNKLILTGTSSTLNIFQFNGANVAGSGLSLQQVSGIDIVAPLNSTILINVSGTNVGFGSYQMTRNGATFAPDDEDYIVFNFYQATTLFMYSMIINGFILAPYANVTPLGTAMLNGQLIAQSFYSVEGIGTLQADDFDLQANLPEVCGETPSTCCNIGLSNVDVQLTGEGAVITVEGLVNNVRFCDVTDYIAVGLSIYDTSSGTNVPLGRQFVKVMYSGPIPFVPGCYDLPFISKFVYVGDMCGTDPIIAVNTMAQYVCNSIDF